MTALLHMDAYTRKVLPHLKPDYFESLPHRTLYQTFSQYHTQYNATPTFAALEVELSNSKSLSETQFQDTVKLASELTQDHAYTEVSKLSFDWLLERTEKFCLDRSVYIAIMSAINIIDGTEKKLTRDAIPDILQKSLAINFNTEIGHEYLEGFEERFAEYHKKEHKIPTPLSMLNKITEGGFPKKTLNVLVSGTGGGKTHAMTYFSSFYLTEGLNVLYVTLEMSESRIGERIDAALLDVKMADLKKYPMDTFKGKIEKLKSKTRGRLIVKEYPVCSVNANHLRFLLSELKIKKNFVPDVIVIDYLNLVAPFRVKNESTYITAKSVAEDLRAIAQEKNVVVLTATQTNRSGQTMSDFELTEVSDSHGVAMTADFVLGLMVTEDLEKLSQMRMKILKNRYGSKIPSSFIAGMDREKMTLRDLDTPQETPTAPSIPQNVAQINTTNKSKLSGFKV